MDEVTVRAGGPEDVALVLGLLDGATEWLVSLGRTDQWGTEPHSTDPRRIDQVTGFATSGGLWIAERGGEAVAALSLGPSVPPVPPVDEPEVYVRLLVSDRTSGRGAGAVLLDHARQIAKEDGITLLRVDCFASEDEALIGYYESQGFTRTERFEVKLPDRVWTGQVLAQRL